MDLRSVRFGQTRLAKKIATDKGNPWFISGSSRDLFQNYNGEHTIILDELRPDDGLTYRDMLRLLDPYGFDMNAPSRYRDKAIAADLIIITSPFTPKEFYDKLFHNTITYFDFIDSFNQLLRRISVIINVNSSDIHREYYDSQTGNLLQTITQSEQILLLSQTILWKPDIFRRYL